MADQVGKMYEGWDKTQLEIARLNRDAITTRSRQVDIEGRVALIERTTSTSMVPSRMSAVESSGHEITERRQNVRVPIPRVTELFDKEKIADEMIVRYAWWSKKARALGVTAGQVARGFTKEVLKYAAGGSVVWAVHHFWPWK